MSQTSTAIVISPVSSIGLGQAELAVYLWPDAAASTTGDSPFTGGGWTAQ